MNLTGTVNEELIYEGLLDEAFNCFKVSEIETTAVHNMAWGEDEDVEFIFEPYYCGDNESESMIAFDLGNGNYDSIYTESQGSGGGESSYKLRIINYELKEKVELINVKSLEDSVSLNLRKRDYERVSDLCYQLLEDHIDSLKDVSVISKLYLAELRLDSAGSRITNLKSFLETLILSNPGRETLIKQAFYVIQKCKVSLGLYQSGMSGFQEIINQNPYSYEGLVASWDYAATSLLSGGQGGGESSYKLRGSGYELRDEAKIENFNQSKIPNSKFQILNDDPGGWRL